jgi:hypothetical protein
VTPQADAPRPRVFHGAGADTDIVVASAKAYLRAINRMLAAPNGPRAASDDLPARPRFDTAVRPVDRNQPFPGSQP